MDEVSQRKPEPELEALELRLERGADGRLWASTGLRVQPVLVRRCFPWTAPARFVSLRDADEEEVALVRDLAELDPESRAALEVSLVEAGFVLEIAAVDDVDDEIEIRTFRVRTRQGPRRFQTLRDEWPRPLPGGGILLRDVAGDLYLVRDPQSLDPASRAKLWALVD
jgi:hypothetical protein